MQFWYDIYKEMAEKITAEMPNIEWVDLWHNQVGFLAEEHPFPAPAVFIEFRGQDDTDLGEAGQQVNLQVEFYLFYESLLDTNRGSYNDDDAVAFLEDLTRLNQLFHASVGNSWDGMRRLGFNRVDTGSAQNLYQVSFTCTTGDLSAIKQFDEATPNEVDVERDYHL